jgi:hypothetical protein
MTRPTTRKTKGQIKARNPKKKKDTKENKNGMFAWLQKLNIFKKSDSEKQENKK